MSYQIPLFDLNYNEEEEKAVLEVLKSKWISMGEKTARMEEDFARHLGVRDAIGVTNCTAALHLALRVLDIAAGDEVIVPSLTFSATVNSIRYTGATPVFADITGWEDFSVSPEEIEGKITPRTKAIVVMHYGGFGCEMDKIMALAKKRGLFVIEDAAHAPDSEYQGKKLGSWGDVSCFSFFSNKNISCGEGGLIATDQEALAKKLRLLRSHGMTTLSYERAKGHATTYDVVELGYNYRMDDIRSALVNSQFKKLPGDIKRREELRKHYIEKLSGIEEIWIPYKNYPHKSCHYIFPLLLKDSTAERRDDLRQALADEGVQTSVHYPAVHRFSIYKDYTCPLPKTEYVADNEFTLPLYFSLKEEQIDYVVEALKKGLVG